MKRTILILGLFGLLFAQEDKRTITFAMVGDIMLGTDYPDDSRMPSDGGKFLFSESAQFLRSADVAIGNLEGPITTATKCSKNLVQGRSYAFRMPPSLAPLLKDAGFDVLNTANNHANDFGLAGREDTERILDSLGIKHTGRLGKIAMLERNGIKISVIGFSHNPGNYPLLDIDRAVELVDSLEKISDIIVATFHGGAEGVEFLNLSAGMEYYLDERRGDLRAFARSLVDAGADIVFGHGPHVPRAMEIYNGKLIAYSLGNFCTWFGISVKGECGLAPLLWAELDSSGNLLDAKIISFEQSSKHYPVLDPENRAENLITRLSLSDVAQNPLERIKSGTVNLIHKNVKEIEDEE